MASKKRKEKAFEQLELNDTFYKTNLHTKFLKRKSYQPVDILKVYPFIPGVIIKVLVKSGAKVKKGDVLIVFDAMKMHNNLLSPVSGFVEEIFVKECDRVAKDTLLIQLQALPDADQ
jgi:biotin carboxyl carrier protein